MSSQQIPATRQELLKLKVKQKSASRGHKLLKDKRDSLVREFIKSYQEAVSLRKEVDSQYFSARNRFRLAKVTSSADYIKGISESSERTITIDSEPKSIMGIKVQELTAKIQGDAMNYSLLETSHHLDLSLIKLEQILPDFIKLIEIEFKVRKLAEEIERTRKRVNALEYVILPELKRQIKLINSKLEELALQNTVRLMKIKKQIAPVESQSL